MNAPIEAITPALAAATQEEDPSTRAEIARVALVSGRSMYWSFSPGSAATLAHGVGQLLARCCRHPGAWLGVELHEVEQLLQDPELSLGRRDAMPVDQYVERLIWNSG